MVDTDLHAMFILMFEGRALAELASAICKAAGDNIYHLMSAMDRETHTHSMYSRTVDGILSDMEEMYDLVPVPELTREQLFERLIDVEMPENVYETMQYVWEEFFDDLKKEGLFVEKAAPPEDDQAGSV